MFKKKPLTAEERALFAEAVKNVKPLGDKSIFLARAPAVKPRVKKPFTGYPAVRSEYLPVDLDILAPEDWVGIAECIQFNRGGLQDKLLKKLARGQIAVEARLDLHRLNLPAALAQLEAFLHHCQQQGCRLVLVIHGKGKQSAKPILKNALNIWLRTQPGVLAFHSAQARDGGTGAVYVLLKKATGIT